MNEEQAVFGKLEASFVLHFNMDDYYWGGGGSVTNSRIEGKLKI